MPRFQNCDGNQPLSKGEKRIFILIISPIIFFITLGVYVIAHNAGIDKPKINCEQTCQENANEFSTFF